MLFRSQMRATLDAVVKTKASSSQIAIVMNRVRRRLLQKIERRNHVESVFPNENIHYIREYSDAVDRVNTGTPAPLAGDGRKDFAQLTAFCTRLRQPVRQEAVR